MKRKILAFVLVGVMAVTTMGCGDSKEATNTKEGTETKETEVKTEVKAEEKTDKKDIKLGYVVSTMSHEWYQNICSGAERRAKEKGVELSISDAGMDSGKQASYAENFISQQVDALILTPVDPAAMSVVATQAKDAKIPLIAESSKFEGMDSFVGITDYDAALNLGVWMADYATKNKIDMKILLIGQPVYEACRDRVKGFLAGLDSKSAKYEVVQEVDGNGTKEDSLAVASNAITAHPEVNVIFGINDNSSTGGMNAYIEQGLDQKALTVLGFGFEGAVGRDALLGDTPYKASVAMFPDYVGAAIVDAGIMAASGEKLPETYSIPTVVISKDNFSQFYTDNKDGTYTTNFEEIDKLLKK